MGKTQNTLQTEAWECLLLRGCWPDQTQTHPGDGRQSKLGGTEQQTHWARHWTSTKQMESLCHQRCFALKKRAHEWNMKWTETVVTGCESVILIWVYTSTYMSYLQHRWHIKSEKNYLELFINVLLSILIAISRTLKHHQKFYQLWHKLYLCYTMVCC